jgi:hypothetical protein
MWDRMMVMMVRTRMILVRGETAEWSFNMAHYLILRYLKTKVRRSLLEKENLVNLQVLAIGSLAVGG